MIRVFLFQFTTYNIEVSKTVLVFTGFHNLVPCTFFYLCWIRMMPAMVKPMPIIL
jgi:hypothetical protein